MTNLSREDALACLAQIRELLQSAHWAARDFAQQAPVEAGELLDQIHGARKAAESVLTALRHVDSPRLEALA